MRDGLPLSQTTKLRLADAVRRVQIPLDPAFRGLRVGKPLSLCALESAIDTDATRDFGSLTRAAAVLRKRFSDLPQGDWGLDPSLTFGGYARLPRGAGPHLFATAGAVLAIEELLLQALAKPDFFHFDDLFDPSDEYRSRAPLRTLSVDLAGPERFVDYGWLRDLRSKDGETALLTTMPLTPWRLCQFELLRELALHWLCLHEASHWLGGHLGFLATGSKRAVARLQLADPELSAGAHAGRPAVDPLAAALRAAGAPDRLSPLRARKCIEYQADHIGFLLLAALHNQQSARAHSAFRRYSDTMRSLELPDFFANVIELDAVSRGRALLVAAATVILLITRAAAVGKTSRHYPIPLARLLNVQMALIAASPFVAKRGDGIFLTADTGGTKAFQEFVGGTLARSLFDFNILSRTLGLETFVESRDGAPVHFASLVRDLLRFFDPTLEPKALESVAAREFYALHTSNDLIRRLCAPYGSIDSTRLTVSWPSS